VQRCLLAGRCCSAGQECSLFPAETICAPCLARNPAAPTTTTPPPPPKHTHTHARSHARSPIHCPKVMDELVYRTARGMCAEGTPFRGVLFAGLMIKDGRVGRGARCGGMGKARLAAASAVLRPACCLCQPCCLSKVGCPIAGGAGRACLSAR
jgi:hypothetical protein